MTDRESGKDTTATAMTSHNSPRKNPWNSQQGRDVGTAEPTCVQGTVDPHCMDEFGMATATPGEWLPNLDDAFDLDFDE
jgi:hypothetical protein